MKKSLGFTLVEVIVVIAILSVVGVMVLTIFTRTLKGSNKSQIIATIKQNGQSVMENIDKTIRDADNAICRSNDGKTLVVLKNGIYNRYIFIPTTSSVNGYIQQDRPSKQIARTTGVEETDPDFINRVCATVDPLNNPLNSPVILTDTQLETGVAIDCVAINRVPDCLTNPIFRIDKLAGFKDQVKIQFDIWPGIGVSPAIRGQIDPVTFQTSIQLR